MKKKIAFALLMGIISTGIISYTLLSVNTPFTGSKFNAIWLKSWGIAYLVVIPVILVIGPQVEKIIHKIIKE